MKKRLFFLFVLLMLAYGGLGLRLGYIQVFKHDDYGKKAKELQTREIVVPAIRGEITDRKGSKLAFSLRSYTVWAHPVDIKTSTETAKTLDGFLSLTQPEIEKLLRSPKEYVQLGKDKLSLEQANALRAKDLPGISIEETVKRVYPKGSLASQVLGVMAEDGTGISGVELSYEEQLKGKSGKITVQTDARGQQLPTSEKHVKDAVDGGTLELTIDEVIQNDIERATEDAYLRTKAASVTAIVMDVKTGEVLGMTSKPDFDPNAPRVPQDPILVEQLKTADDKGKVDIWNRMWQNRAVTGDYEPGSVFKLITYSGGIDSGAITRNTQFSCDGFIKIPGWPKPIKCHIYPQAHGIQTMDQALKNSCNPAAVEMEMKLGKDRFYQYLTQFHIDKRTGIDLPGESKPIFHQKNKVGLSELATMSFGHGLAVTPIRMLSSVAAIGNQGKLMEPHVVRSIKDSKGNVIKSVAPKVVAQAIKPEAAAQMLLAMEAATKEASEKAYLQGYRIGGKTGTSNKAVNGKYDESRVVASFTAIAPVDNPRLAILVVVDDPDPTKIQYGSFVAAPVGYEILRDILAYLQIPPKLEGNVREVPTPQLKGMPIAQAKAVLQSKNLSWALPGNLLDETGFVVEDQYPKAGQPIYQTSRVILYPVKK